MLIWCIEVFGNIWIKVNIGVYKSGNISFVEVIGYNDCSGCFRWYNIVIFNFDLMVVILVYLFVNF